MNLQEIQRSASPDWEAFASPDQSRILIGTGTCGKAAGADETMAAARALLEQEGIPANMFAVGCLGLCFAEPLVELSKPGSPHMLYGNVTPGEMPGLLSAYYREEDLCADRAVAVMEGGPVNGVPLFAEHPMLKNQVRIALRNCGMIDPENINHYISRGGYAGLAHALELSPQAVVEEVKKSGLRGRGGAGFPTGMKWEFCQRSKDDRKYMICNADEGDPGAFMDRSVLESDPHSVLEGMAIAAYAIGANSGYIYARAEYPLAIARLKKAIAQAGERGLIGDRILDSTFDFHVRIKEGAGAFVCGEETALMASIEGKRGMPRPRPPFPAQSGLFGKPTNINNVETLANVGPILARGSAWFSEYGTEKSKGTKTFALAGKIVRTGLIEVPLGTSLNDIVFSIGGGIPDDKRIKAVQTGGPSGGCIPAELLDLPVDYERLAEAGAIMGSGGMVVMDEDTCMVDIARYFVEFTQSESCGKCAPCRLGTKQMLTILNRITSGHGRLGDIQLLRDIGSAVKQGSLCGLGQTAPNPVLTTLEYFADEYTDHIKRKHCAATVCRGLVTAPCTHTCPAGIDVPRYVRYIEKGKFVEACDVIREKIPFPSVCGYICFHPCEAKCRRGQIDEPIAIRALKRFAAEQAAARKRRKRTPRAKPTGKKVCIVGSGPAGLTAAYYLGKRGHKVTVLEKDAEPGGTLWSGIPAFRLPREIIDAEITDIRKSAGVRIRTNTPARSIDKLVEKYDAVLLAHGAQKGLKMGIDGEDDAGVFDCLDFLRQVAEGAAPKIGAQVAVIGGGSSAMDAARVALRNGAKEVTVVYRRTRQEMPAAAEELEEAIEEGIEMRFLAAPVEISRNNGNLTMKCANMELGPVDRSGRRRPIPIEHDTFDLPVDSVIMAVGQAPAEMEDPACNLDKRGRVKVDEDNLQTTRPGLFAAGDAVTGPASVIEAIAAGRRAASAIDIYLGGDGDISEILAATEDKSRLDPPEEQDEQPRVAIPKRPVRERLADKGQVELSYSENAAVAEAARCLRCDLEEEPE